MKVACSLASSRETCAVCGACGDGEEFDLGGVEGDGGAGAVEGEVDGLGAGKGRGFEVGRESERVVLGVDAGGKALGVGCGCESGCG